MNRLLFIFLCTITFTRSYYVLPNFFHGTLGNGVSRSNRNHKQLLERIISIPLALTNRNNDAAEEPVEQVACRESVGSYNEDSVPGVDIDSECHNSTDNCSGSDSVHLKLYELGSLRDNSDKDNLENSDPSHPALSSPYTNSTTETVICEYVNSSNGSVILACFGSKFHLEYFSQYVYGLNYSEIAGAEYREV